MLALPGLRAQHHINDLNAKITEFVTNKSWPEAVDGNLTTGQNVHKIKFARHLPKDLPSIVFDAAININGRKVYEDCPPEIIALFRGFHPYKGGNDTIWALNKLCNTKKQVIMGVMSARNP